MPNVRIEAIGDCGLEIEVLLGKNSRGSHSVNSGDTVELTVGGNQRLEVHESKDAAPTAKASDADQDVPLGADVSDQPKEKDNSVLAGLGTALFGDSGDFDPEG